MQAETAAAQVQAILDNLKQAHPCHRKGLLTCWELQDRMGRKWWNFNPGRLCSACGLRWHLQAAHRAATKDAA